MTWLFLTLIAVLFVSTEALLEKRILRQERTLEFATMAAFANALLSIPFLFFIDLSGVTPFLLAFLFLSSLPATGSLFFAFKSLKHIELSESAPLFALLPLLVTFFAYIFLGERISSGQLTGLLLMVVGLFFLEMRNFRASQGIFQKGRRKYVLFLFFALFLGATSAIFDRLLLSRYGVPSLTYLAIMQCILAINFAIIFFSQPYSVSAFGESIKRYWKIVLFISCLTCIHRYAHTLAIQVASSVGLVTAIYRLSSVSNVFLGGRFFHEQGILRKVFATAIIIAGALFLI